MQDNSLKTSLENATETRRFGVIKIKTKSIRIKSLSKVSLAE